jgi:hypothetical protein
VGEQTFGSERSDGLSGARMDLVSSYVAQATGPPPRSALRFWINGEWVEMPAPEPEPPVEVLAPPAVPEPVAVETPRADGPADIQAPVLVVETSDESPAQDLPIYRWFDADEGERAVPGWPRSLLTRRDP